jgi:hypothetical protein
MVIVSTMSMIEVQHFVVASLVGQALNVPIDIYVTVHLMHYVLMIQFVYVLLVGLVLGVIFVSHHVLLYHVKMVVSVYLEMNDTYRNV